MSKIKMDQGAAAIAASPSGHPGTVTALPQTNSTSVLPPMDPLTAMIERAARDPSIDMERLERLIQMRDAAQLRQAASDFSYAMAQVQKELTPIARDCNNPQTRSKYASYYAIDRVLRPIIGRYDIRISFDTADNGPDDHVRVIAIVSLGMHTERYHYDSPVITAGFKGTANMTLTHAKASAVTYGRRYLVGMIFNLSTGENSDDDGNAAGGMGATISDDQLMQLEMIMQEVGANFEAFCKLLKVESLDKLPSRQFDSALALLNLKKEKKK
jgi:hypothetical protein